MNSFGKLCEEYKDTKFVLKNLDLHLLDKQYMADIHELGIEQLSKSLKDQEADTTLTKLSSRLEFAGLSKNKCKPYETIVLNESDIRLFISPTFDARLIEQRQHCCCWYCRTVIPYDWSPVGIPIKYKSVDNSFDVEGVFCSFNCVVAYLSEHTCYRYKHSSTLLLMLYHKIFKSNKIMNKIIPSPSWKLLKDYGGHMTSEEYHKCLQHVEFKSLHQTLKVESLKIQQVSEIFIEAQVVS